MNKGQKGFAHLAILLAAIVVVGIIVIIAVGRSVNDPSMELTQTPTSTSEEVTFEPLEEPEGTPEEIDNESLDELDNMIKEIEETADTEDLSDLGM